MINCSPKCKHYRLIEEIRAACLACPCCSGKTTMQAGGRGLVYLDGADDAQAVLAHATGRACHAPAEPFAPPADEPRNVTALPPEVEEKLRGVLSTFFGLRQTEVLLLHHLANGGNLSTFGDCLASFARQAAAYKHFDKRNSWAILKRGTTVFAPFKALAGGLIGKGKGGAKAQPKPVIQEEFAWPDNPTEA